MRTPRLTLGLLALLCLASCSGASRMSVGGPGTLAPVARAGDGQRPAQDFTRSDGLETHDRGFVLISGDSLILFDRRGNATGLEGEHGRPVYRSTRVVRQLSISGYQRSGRWQDWPGWVRPLGDSLELYTVASQPGRLRRPVAAETLRVPASEIGAFRVNGQEVVRAVVGTTLMVALFSGVVYLGWLVAAFTGAGN